MSNRITNITALLDRSRQDLASIEREYNDSLLSKRIEPSLRIDIKNLCGNLRSALDYLAKDIRTKYSPPAKSGEHFYFPILPDSAQFHSQVSKWFPDLKSNCPDLYAYLEAIQPYQSKKTVWIGLFNRLNNENKHGDLVEQTRSETKQVKVSTQGGGSVAWNPDAVKFGPGVFIGGVPVDPRTQMPIPHPSQTVEVITWVDFRFDGINASALWLLKELISGITKIVSDVQKWL
jgi:hypothetical protein